MKINRIAEILAFLLGLELIVFSWIRSYPLQLDSPNDYMPNHIFPSYWIGLGLANVSLFLFLKSNKSRLVRAFGSFIFVMLIYSIYFFYPLLPGPDSHYFRGLCEYTFNRDYLDPHIHYYFQWPGFFFLNKFLFLITNLSINELSVCIFIITGFILAISLYNLIENFEMENAYLMTMLYFVGIYHFINYQFAPQSLALGIVFILLNLFEKEGIKIRFLILLFFITLTFFHAIMPVILILYIFCIILFSKSKSKIIHKSNYSKSSESRIEKNITVVILIFLISIFISTYIYQSYIHFEKASITIRNSLLEFGKENEYGRIILVSLYKPINALDQIAQNFSKVIIISLWLILSIGFLIRLVKKNLPYRILIMAAIGFLYLFFGFFANILGVRAIQILFIPSLFGIVWFSKKFKFFTFFYIMSILLLFPMIRIHIDYNNEFVYQSKSGNRASNFFINNCYLENSVNYIFMSNPDGFFFEGKTEESWKHLFHSIAGASNYLKRDLSKSEIPFTFIIYNYELDKEISRVNLGDVNHLLNEWNRKMDKIYSDGISIIFLNRYS